MPTRMTRNKLETAFVAKLQYAVTQHSIYLFHCNCSLDPCCHGVHPSAHPQIVHRLVLLSDGVLCMDPCHFRIPLLDSLEAVQSDWVKSLANCSHWALIMCHLDYCLHKGNLPS